MYTIKSDPAHDPVTQNVSLASSRSSDPKSDFGQSCEQTAKAFAQLAVGDINKEFSEMGATVGDYTVGQAHAGESKIKPGSSTNAIHCSAVPEAESLESSSYCTKHAEIGLKSLPEQKMNHVANKGKNYTIMLAGGSGLGKSSFINTLFTCDIFHVNEEKGDCRPKPNSIVQTNAELYEEKFKLNLRLLRYPSFGTHINNALAWVPMCNYIDEKSRRYMYQEEQPDRSQMVDERVHVCLYFISPSSKGLNTLDLISIKELSQRVNFIPIIPKADGCTKMELQERKLAIKKILAHNGIEVCKFLQNKELISKINRDMPYSTIASQGQFLNDSGNLVRGRKYSWGISEVENEDHCDFIKLRKLLMSENMLDIMLGTEHYYEKCRKELCLFRLYQESLLAKGMPMSEASQIVKIGEDGTLIKNFTDVDYELTDDNGIQNMIKISKIDAKVIEKFVLESAPVYLYRQLSLKQRFSGVVNNQDQKFRDWKKALLTRQSSFNRDIEIVYEKVKKLQLEIETLSNAKSSKHRRQPFSGSTFDSTRSSFTEDESYYDEDDDDDDDDDSEEKLEKSSVEEMQNGVSAPDSTLSLKYQKGSSILDRKSMKKIAKRTHKKVRRSSHVF